MSASSSNLKQRGHTWYVQVAIPRHLQPLFGKSPRVFSLKTRDRKVAVEQKHAVLAQIYSEFRAAEAPAPPRITTAQEVLEQALQVREQVEMREISEKEAIFGHEATVDDFLEAQARLRGTGSDGHPNLPANDDALIRRSFSALSGHHKHSLSRLAPIYLKESELNLTSQTIEEKRRRITAFLEWFGGEREASEVTRKVAGAFVTNYVQKRTRLVGGESKPVSATTRVKDTSDVRTFFQWLTDRSHIDENPFANMTRSIKESTRGDSEKGRLPWLPAQFSALIHNIEQDDPMWSFVALGAYTGMRADEIGRCRIEDVGTDDEGNLVIQVKKAKTHSSPRPIPIHPAITPLLWRLMDTSSDGYLIPGLVPGGADRKRCWYLSKRFGNKKRQLGFESTRLVFHSFRSSVTTQLLEAGIPEHVIHLLIGHKRDGVTLNSYNVQGVSLKHRREALLKYTMGDVVDAFVAERGAHVTVGPSAPARKK